MNQNFFKKVGVRAIALLLTFIMLFSILPLTTFAATVNEERAAAQNRESAALNSIVDPIKGRLIGQLYSNGFYAAGKMLLAAADATDNDTAKSVASFVNVWILGNSTVTGSLDKIQNTCDEILNEVKSINTKLDENTAKILQEIKENDMNQSVNRMDQAWSDGVVNVLSNYCLTEAFDAYYNINLISSNMLVSNKNIGYLPAAISYKEQKDFYYETYNGSIYDTANNKISYNKKNIFSEAQVTELGNNLKSEFKGIHSLKTHEQICTDEALYTDNIVDIQFQNAIKALTEALEKTTTDYGGYAAKYAYLCYPNLCDQYEYVRNNINKQLMVITLTEMLYQEFLSKRDVYLQEKHPLYNEKTGEYNEANQRYWDNYDLCVYGIKKEPYTVDNSIKGYSKVHNDVLDIITSYFNTSFKLDETHFIRLSEYPSYEDLNGVKLKNTKYKNKYTKNDYLKDPTIKDSNTGFTEAKDPFKITITQDFTSKANKTSQYVSFNKVPLYTKKGIKMCYFIAGDENTLSTKNLVAKSNKKATRWYMANKTRYCPTCDFYNLTKGEYYDGSNTYTCPSKVSDLSYLTNSESFIKSGSKIYNYLNFKNYYNFGNNDNICQIFSEYSFSAGAWKDTNADFNIYNTTHTDNNTETLNAKDLYNSKSASCYTAILVNENATLKNTISAQSNNSNVKVSIKNGGDTVGEKTSVYSGTVLTLNIDCPKGYMPNSVSILRYNNMETPNKPTSENTLFTKADFDSIKPNYNEKTQTYTYSLDVAMPYSNCKLVIDASKAYTVNVDNQTLSSLLLDNNKSVYEAGKTVSFTCTGKVDSVYKVLDGVENSGEYIQLTYNAAKNISTGSFTMPANDVTLKISMFLPTDDDGNFIIKTYEDLVNMASNVNSGIEYYVNGNYILAKDIDCSGNTWSTPIGTSEHPFKGTFDGQGYTISNLKISSFDKDNNAALFGKVDNATIKNLSVFGNIALQMTNDSSSCVGGICADTKASTILNCISSVQIESTNINSDNKDSNFNIAPNFVGGVCGCSAGGRIENCAFVSSINVVYSVTSGIANSLDYYNSGYTDIKNCYSYSNSSLIYPISQSKKVENCYYLASEDYSSNGELKSEAQFKSGEVAYLLNKGVTDGTQAWYQNLDNGLTPDNYPVLVNNNQNTVYKISNNKYSNYIKYKVNVDNQSNSTLTFDSGKTEYATGDTVSFTCTGNVPSVVMTLDCENNSEEIIKLTYDSDKDISTGSFTMPANDVTLKLCSYKVSVDNSTDSKLTFDSDKTEYFAGDTVSFTCTGNVLYIYKTLDGKSNSKDIIELTYDSDKDISTGSFTMPASDVTLKISMFLPTDDEGNFIIKTYEDLCSMATAVNEGVSACTNGNYILANDIDCSGNTWSTPIGTSSHPFKGTFDGQGYTISNLRIKSANSAKNAALFGVVDGGTIKNLNLSNAKLNSSYNTSKAYVSPLCSKINNGKIANCYVDGNVIVKQNIGEVIGGICAKAEASVIEKCMSSVDIDAYSGIYDSIGGICGEGSKSQINNCAFLSSISVNECIKVSGIANCDKNTTVSNCYSICSKTLKYAISNEGIVDNCYYLVSDNTDISNDSMKHKAQFESGEVAYLLNNGTTDGTQAWYQNLDNGLTPDSYPVLVNNNQNTVYKINDNKYSNYPTGSDPTTEPTEQPTTQPTTAPATEPTEQPTTQPTTAPTTEPTEPTTQPTTAPATEPTEQPATPPATDPTTPDNTNPNEMSGARVYYRYLNESNGNYISMNDSVSGIDEKTADNKERNYGSYEVDNVNKVITITVNNATIFDEDSQKLCTLGSIGIMKSQKGGTVTFSGCLTDEKNASTYYLENKKEEPDIYVDANGCCFIKLNSNPSHLGADTSNLVVHFTPKGKNAPTVDYKVNVVIKNNIDSKAK